MKSQIKFNQPVTLLPHQQRGLYCHSSLPDDLGIQYQSYQSKESIVAANEVRPALIPLFLPLLSFPPVSSRRKRHGIEKILFRIRRTSVSFSAIVVDMLHYDILLIALPLTSRLSCSFLSCSPDLTRSTSLCSLGWGTQGSSPSMSSTAGIERGEDYQALCPTGACCTALHCTVILMHLSHRKHLTLHTGRQRLDTTPMTFLESMTYY